MLVLQMWYLERIFVAGSVSTPLKLREVLRVKHWSKKATARLLETVSRISVDVDDDKIHMLEDALVGDHMDQGESANVRDTMGVKLRQQANIMAQQDAIDARLTSLHEEMLWSLNGKLERL